MYSIPLLFGVTLISFVLMVYFGPDKTYDLLGRNPTIEEINEIRHQLGYDQPFFVRYFEYIKEVLLFDFGYSDSTGERVTSILAKTIPVSIALQLPRIYSRQRAGGYCWRCLQRCIALLGWIN